MTPQKSWGDFYADAGGVDYLLDHTCIHKDFLKEILKRKPGKALEAGCGSAIMSIFLAMAGVQVTACDRDDEVLEMGAATAAAWKTRVDFKKADLLNLSFPMDSFDVSFSQGVLEHMTDEQIQKSCRELLKISPVFIFSVPGIYYKHKDFGDERLLSMNEWKNILKDIGSLEMKPYFYERTKKNFFMRRPLMWMGVLSQ